MWLNQRLFDVIIGDSKATTERLVAVWNTCHVLQTKFDDASAQKAKDDVTIDWLRHRVNALEKQNSILVMKTSGVVFPVPEIVPTRPGTMSELPGFDTMPSFEDVGPAEAQRLGIVHGPDGSVEYTK